MRAWVNGRLYDDPTQPAISAVDHGVTVGDGVFEAIKVVDGEPFALTRHLARMLRSAEGLQLPAPDPALVRDAITAVLEGQVLPLGRIRVTWTAGPAPLGSGRGDGTPTLAVVAGAADPANPTTAVVTVPWPRNERGALAGLKTTSYGENVLALAHAHQRRATEAIFANTVGNLCEGTGTNVFYVVDGELRTPSLASGCLAGVTRDLLLEWHGAREVDEPLEVLGEASEILLTSTVRNVQGVIRCDERELVGPGPITREAMRAWKANEAQGMDP